MESENEVGTTQAKSILSLGEAWKLSLLIAGKHANKLKQSFLLFIIAYLGQALAFACFFPLLFALSAGKPLSEALVFLFLMAGFCLLDVCCRWFAHEFDYSGTIADVSHELREKLGKKLKNIPLATLSRFRTGELNAILAGSVEEAVVHMGVTSSLLLQTMVVPSFIVLILFFLDPQMAFLLFCLLFPAIPVYRWRRKSTRLENRELAKSYAAVESDVVEYIQGLSDLRAMNRTGKSASRLQASLGELHKTQVTHQKSAQLPSLVMASIVEVGLLAVLCVGVFRVSGGSLALPLLGALLVIISRFSEPLAIFIHITPVLDMVETAFSRIRKLLSIKDLPVPEKMGRLEGMRVSFENVRFSYEKEEEPVLDGVSFDLQEGTFTALVGPSGAGKTTITRLLMRYADPASGRISIGGTDIRSMDQKTLMACFSVVFQDVYLFNDTILNNIRMGRMDADDEDVQKAAEAAYCHEFISRLPKGYDTEVGDIGGSLSGGERQRISIARAILKNAPIVILDEPTAALDTESERHVQRAMDALVKNRSLLVIAHRLSTIMFADTILFIEDGKIAEKGSHTELMTKRGRYFDLWQAQIRDSEEWRVGSIVSHENKQTNFNMPASVP